MNTELPKFSYLYGQPTSTGFLRSEMADFKVFEVLPFEPCGEGEHVFIHVKKTGENTAYIAKQLAKYFGVKENLVSYAGLKDRFAVTEQWFGIHLPGKKIYDLANLSIDGLEVISTARHNKKLRIGALLGNRFKITLKNITEIEAFIRRWHAVVAHGVPNYFGEQRFGIEGGNIAKALALFTGTKVNDKKKRGMYLSAARSLIFNQIIDARIQANTFEQLTDGDVCMLSGTQSVFVANAIDNSLITRLQEKDIDITAPMWGAGELMSTQAVKVLEQQVASEYQIFCDGLAKFGLKQERRKIRLCVTDATIDVDKENNTVVLGFFLPAGSYATTVIRELLDYTDLTQRQVPVQNHAFIQALVQK